MAIQFLCANHRQQLLHSPIVAQARWNEWMETGREAFSQRDWLKALKFLGCSFELSELLLNQTRKPLLSDLDRYMLAGHFLAECFAHCGDVASQRHCLMAVHHRLMAVLTSPEGRGLALKCNVEISLQMLQRHFDKTGESAQIQACYDESMGLLKRAYH
jgi:hypothetical protein